MRRHSIQLEDAAESLETIRSVLDRTTRYTHISWAGVLLSGVVAVSASACGSLWEIEPAPRPGAFLVLWGCAFLAALCVALWTASRKARLVMEHLLGRKLQTVVSGLLPAFVVACLITVALAREGSLELAPGVWMALYGVGILAVGPVLDWEFQVTAWAFLLASAVSFSFLREAPQVSMALGFGGIHAALGLYRLRKENSWPLN